MNSFRQKAVASILAVTLAVSVVGMSPSAQAIDDPTFGIPADYQDYEVFPLCDQGVTTFCVEAWGVDLTSSGRFDIPAESSGITFNAWLFSIKDFKTPSIAYELRLNGNQELAPTIPAGTPFQFTINTGAFQPPPTLFTQADVQNFEIRQENGSWKTSATLKTGSWPFALGCETDGDCLRPTNQIDYQSFSQGVQFYESPNALLAAKTGMWTSTNAAVTGSIQFDRQTMTWSVALSGPARKADGTENTLRYTTFIPDAFIRLAYGTTADVLATTLVTTRTDDDEVAVLPATITRVTSPQPGLLISMPTIRLSGVTTSRQSVMSYSGNRYSTAPTVRIRPKNVLLSAPRGQKVTRRNSRSVRISSSPVRGASKYQAMCVRGANTITRSSRKPNISIVGLSKGKWNCYIRGVSKVGGKWSNKVRVKI